MEPTLVFAQVMTVIVLSFAGISAVGLGTRYLWRLGSRQKPQALPPVDDVRMQRLEEAVESIAIEVERISEGQRFTVTLLSERLPPRGDRANGELLGGGQPKRINTPH